MVSRLAAVSLAGSVHSHKISRSDHEAEHSFLVDTLSSLSANLTDPELILMHPTDEDRILGLEVASIHEALYASSDLVGKEGWWKGSSRTAYAKFLGRLGYALFLSLLPESFLWSVVERLQYWQHDSAQPLVSYTGGEAGPCPVKTSQALLSQHHHRVPFIYNRA